MAGHPVDARLEALAGEAAVGLEVGERESEQAWLGEMPAKRLRR
jgi:hypothetical protein